MTWFKVDDQLAFHPKVLAAGNSAMGLWVRAGAWASAQLTDGFVADFILPALGAKKGEPELLVSAGLWFRADGGYQFHDWEIHNPSAAVTQKTRADRRSASMLANHKRWHVKRGITDLSCRHCIDRDSQNGSQNGSVL